MQPMIPISFAAVPGVDAGTAKEIALILKDNRPVGIGFDDSFLVDPKSPTGNSSHGALVVASKWIEARQRCEFKVRNTIGSDCARYHSVFSLRCENGHVWLTEDEMNRSVFSVQSIARARSRP